MILELVGKLATAAIGIGVEILALRAYWSAAEIASPVAIVLSLVLAVVGFLAIAKAGERFP